MPKQDISKLTIPISGMTCSSCASHVENALKGIQGVSNAFVNMATEKVDIRFANGKVGSYVRWEDPIKPLENPPMRMTLSDPLPEGGMKGENDGT